MARHEVQCGKNEWRRSFFVYDDVIILQTFTLVDLL